MGLKQLQHGDYTIGWICALPLEQRAAIYMLDERHKGLQNPLSDENTYTLGRIGGHNVVIVGLPKGRIGTNDSAAVITRMASTFPNIKFGMMVGVGGGIPDKTRLGDVVICSALGTSAGVVQHDMGTHAGGQFERRGFLSGPPTAVLTAISKLEADPETLGQMHSHLEDMATIPFVDESYLRSDSLKDILFESDYIHENKNKDCSRCDKDRIVQRVPRRRVGPEIRYGLVASGNTKVKDAKVRDELCERYDGNLYCIEMEAAGLMNNFPCVVIRGICDYADSHAGKEWQNYAAAVAAACTKTLLGVVPERDVSRLQSLQDIVTFSNIGPSRKYEIPHHADSPPPSPQAFKGTAAPAPRMIGGPSTEYYGNTAYTRHGEPRYNANDFIGPLGEAFANLLQGGNRRAEVTEETIDIPRAQATKETINLPQTPPRSPKRKNHEHPRLPEDGSGFQHTKTDLDSAQSSQDGDPSSSHPRIPQNGSRVRNVKTGLDSTQSSQDGDLSGSPKPVQGSTFPKDRRSDIAMNKVASTSADKKPSTDYAVFFNAIETENVASIESQLQNGADLEMVNEFGLTPLWYAILRDKRSVIQLLLEKDADTEAKNFHGQNILAWAVGNKRNDIVEMLGYN